MKLKKIASNFHKVVTDKITIWFSYETPIAFLMCLPNMHTPEEPWLWVRQNEWGTTTGKHLNMIDNGRKQMRIPGDRFVRQLDEALGGLQ